MNGKKTSKTQQTKVFKTSSTGRTQNRTRKDDQLKESKEEENYKRSHPIRGPSRIKDPKGFLVVEKLGPTKIAIYRNHAGTGGTNRPIRRSILSSLGKRTSERISGGSARRTLDARSGNRLGTSIGHDGLHPRCNKIVVLNNSSSPNTNEKLPMASFTAIRSDKVGGKVSTLSYDPSKNSGPREMFGIPLSNDKGPSSLDSQSSMTGDLNNLKLDTFDFLMALTIPANTSAGDILYSVVIDPSLFQRTRGAVFSNLFDRADLEAISLHYESGSSEIESGAIIMYFDPDPDSNPISGQMGIEFAASTGTLNQLQVFKNGSSFWKPPVTEDNWTHDEGSDPRLFAFGKIVILAATSRATVLGAGNIYLGLHIRYKEPVLNLNSFFGYGLECHTLGTVPDAGHPLGQQLGLVGVDPMSNLPDIWYSGLAPLSVGTFIFPTGFYLIVGYFAGGNIGSPTHTIGSKITNVNQGTCTIATNALNHFHVLIKVDNGTELERSYALTYSTLIGNITSYQFYITQMPNFTPLLALQTLNYVQMVEKMSTLQGQVDDLQNQFSEINDTPIASTTSNNTLLSLKNKQRLSRLIQE